MQRALRIGFFTFAALVPSTVWASEATMPLGAVFLSGVGATAIGFGGVLCLKLYAVLKGGELGAAWQSIAFALLFLAAALVVDTLSGAGWVSLPAYVAGLLKLLAAIGLVMGLLRFSKVFR